MSETKTVKRFVFIYPDNRQGSANTIIGEGFEVERAADGSWNFVREADGSYALSISLKKTVVEKLPGQPDKTSVLDTGRTKTILVRPAYLWVEIEEVDVPV